jgi:hypothetical protein
MLSDSSFKKAPGYPGARNQTQARESGLGHHIGDCEKNDNCERADQKHVANVVTRDARARFTRATIRSFSVCGIGHSVGNSAATTTPVPRGCSARALKQQRVQMWSVPNVYPGSVTLSGLFS